MLQNIFGTQFHRVIVISETDDSQHELVAVPFYVHCKSEKEFQARLEQILGPPSGKYRVVVDKARRRVVVYLYYPRHQINKIISLLNSDFPDGRFGSPDRSSAGMVRLGAKC